MTPDLVAQGEVRWFDFGKPSARNRKVRDQLLCRAMNSTVRDCRPPSLPQ